MKKVFSLFIASLLSMTLAFNAYAIEDPDPVGSLTLGAHATFYPGLGTNLFGDYVLVDSWWRGHFTIGAQAAFSVYKYSGYSDTRTCLVPRVTYGLNITPNLEVHAGILSGLGYLSAGTSDNHAGGIRLVYGEILGARFFLNDVFGFSAEFNYANLMPYLNAGIVIKL